MLTLLSILANSREVRTHASLANPHGIEIQRMETLTRQPLSRTVAFRTTTYVACLIDAEAADLGVSSSAYLRQLVLDRLTARFGTAIEGQGGVQGRPADRTNPDD